MNPGEAAAVVALVRALLDAGVPAGDIGVVSPYRAQVNHLQSLLAPAAGGGGSGDGGDGRGGGGEAALQQPKKVASGVEGEGGGASASASATGTASSGGVEVLTIDRYQGRDKAVILLSLVRSNPHGAAGQLLTDWQRLNVALTRARVKLLVVGSARTLSSVPMLGRLARMAEECGWMVRLPEEATRVSAPGRADAKEEE